MEEANALEHYGTKGMRWGVRKASSVGAGAGGSSVNDAPPKSVDAISAHAAREKARTHGVHTLSNQELRELNSRTDLETRYNTLHKMPHQKRLESGAKFVKNMGKAVLLGPITVVLAGYTTNILKNNLPKQG